MSDRNGHTDSVDELMGMGRRGELFVVGGVELTAAEYSLAKDVVYNEAFSRSQLIQGMLDPRVDVWAECGFPKGPVTAVRYKELFDRNPIAKRIVSFEALESWAVTPWVYESDDAKVETPFEAGWDSIGAMLRGEDSWFREEEGSIIWEYCLRAQVAAGVGGYGVMLLGLDDNADLATPAKPKKGQELTYVRVFPEALAPVSRRVADEGSRRHGQPETYQITFDDPTRGSWGSAALGAGTGRAAGVKEVHWTRVVHVCPNPSENEWAGTPELEVDLNTLIGLEKMYGASPAGYWRSSYTALALEAVQGITNIDEGKVRQALLNFRLSQQKDLAPIKGMTAKTLPLSVNDPSPHVTAAIDAICMGRGWAIRIFKGSERGELASSQDERDHRKKMRRKEYVTNTPRVVVPLVDRLIWLGVLPAPKDGYKVKWPPLDTATAAEKAAVGAARVGMYDVYTKSAMGTLVAPADFMAEFDSMDEEQVKVFLENASAAKAEQDAEAALKEAAAADATYVPPEIDPETGEPVPPEEIGAAGEPAVGEVPAVEGEDPEEVEDEETGETLTGNAAAKYKKKLTGGRWVTMAGRHVYIKGGKIAAGPAGTVGKKPAEAKLGGEKPPAKKATPAKKSTPAKKPPEPKKKQPPPKPKRAVKKKTEPKKDDDIFDLTPVGDHNPTPGGHPKHWTDADRLDQPQEMKNGWGEYNKYHHREAAAEHLAARYGDWGKKLTGAQTAAVRHYQTDDGYEAINGGLRGGKGGVVPKAHAETVKHLDAAIAASTGLKEDTKVFRGLQGNLTKMLKPGSEFTDRGYTSTTINGHTARGFSDDAVISLTIPKGHKAAVMDAVPGRAKYAGADSENEILLPRGTRYRITHKTTDPTHGVDIYHAEIVT